jgi:hypothetical protein
MVVAVVAVELGGPVGVDQVSRALFALAGFA